MGALGFTQCMSNRAGVRQGGGGLLGYPLAAAVIEKKNLPRSLAERSRTHRVTDSEWGQ